jgi:hypothetical protein
MSRLILAAIAIVALVGVVLAATGALRFQNTENQSGVTLDKKELKEKTQEVIRTTKEAGSKVLDKTSESLHKAAEGLRTTPQDRPPTAAPGGESTRQPVDKAGPGKNIEHDSHL